MENFLMIVPVIGILALLFAIATSVSIGKKDAGNDRMKEIAGAIAEGARAKTLRQKGLDSDDTLESRDAPKKQLADAGNLSGKVTEAQE